MGLILGYFCLLSFCILVTKTITRRCKHKKADAIWRKLHKPASAAFLLLGVLHLVKVLPLLKNRSPLLTATGLSSLILLAAIILSYHLMKGEISQKLRCHRILSAALSILILLHMAAYFTDYRSYQLKIRSIHLQSVETSSLADGRYTGAYDAGYIYAKVQVTISDGIITDINLLEHRHERGQTAESLLTQITKTKTFPVDAVTGATNSSKVIQKAIQTALETARP